MPGAICLQGGAEFGRACRPLDLEVVGTARPGPIVALPAAAASGDEYRTAGRNAVRYYTQLVGAGVVAAPDPREDLDGCLEVLGQAALVVLPGGAPRRLLDVVAGPVGDLLRDLHGDGCVLSGASAGAMVLCERTMVPAEEVVADGLGLVPGLALPHFDGTDRWRDRLPDDLPRWGLPECGGVLIADGTVRSAGAGEPVVMSGTRVSSVPSQPVPLGDLLDAPQHG